MNKKYAQLQPLFSIKEDLIIFLGPLLISFFCIFILFLLNIFFPISLNKERLSVFFYCIYIVLFLTPHVYSTFYKVNIDSTLSIKPYKNEMRVFLFICVTACIAFSLIGQGFMYIVTYLDIFHNVRQQSGWLVLTQKKQGKITQKEKFIDTLMIYNVTIFPLLWWHANPTQFGWMQKNDIIFIFPQLLGYCFICIHWIINSYCFGVYLFWYFNKIDFNLERLLIIFVTFLSYYGGIVFLPDGLKTIPITFCHTIPYLFLVFRYYKNKKNNLINEGVFGKLVWTKFYLPLFFVGFFILLLQLIEIPRLFYINKIFVLIPMLVAIFHYFFDSFIWRTRDKKTIILEFFKFSEN